MEINRQTLFEIKKKHYFCTRTSEAYKILQKRNLIQFFFLFCPTRMLQVNILLFVQNVIGYCKNILT